jgi:predicted phage terminase large subunit-like protein
LIEDKANGSAIIEVLKKEFSRIIAVNPMGGKEARASAIEPLWNGGNIYVPKFAMWVPEWKSCWEKFPKGRYDDPVDSGTQALTHLETSGVTSSGHVSALWG